MTEELDRGKRRKGTFVDKIELIAETFLYGIVSGERKEKEEAGRSEVPQEV